MRIILFLSIIFLYSCTSTKTVLICGDHECINKEEAKLFFDENLTLEVQVFSKNEEKNYNLVKMNLKDEKENIKIIKSKNKKIVKKLTKNQIKYKKKEIKEKKSKNLYKSIKKQTTTKKEKTSDFSNKSFTDMSSLNICLKLEKCDIDTISEYLIKLSIKKDYPNIALKND